MEQGPDDLGQHGMEGLQGGDPSGATDTSGGQAANEEPESLDDTAAQRPASDS